MWIRQGLESVPGGCGTPVSGPGAIDSLTLLVFITMDD